MHIATGRRLKLHQLDQSGCGFSRIFIPDSAKPETIFTLLLTWTAWQAGSGYCTAIAHLPAG